MAERIYEEVAARCQQDQGDLTNEDTDRGEDEEKRALETHREKERQLAILQVIYQEEQESLRRCSIPSQWPHKVQVQWIRSKYDAHVQPWAAQSQQVGGMPNLRRKKYQLLLKNCEQWLGGLEKLAVSPELRQDADLDSVLATVYLKEDFHFPVPLRERAKLLHSKWEMIHWGEPT